MWILQVTQVRQLEKAVAFSGVFAGNCAGCLFFLNRQLQLSRVLLSKRGTCRTMHLASTKIAIADKSLAFSNRKVQVTSFTADIAENHQSRRKNRRKNRCNFWGSVKVASFPRLQSCSVFGTLRPCISAVNLVAIAKMSTLFSTS